MKDFDRYLRSKAEQEEIEIPGSVEKCIEQTLASLPEREDGSYRIYMLPRIVKVAACAAFVALFLLPNVSVAYAQAMEEIPVIGDIVRVITIRNYFYSDDRHEMDLDVPRVESGDEEASDFINKSVEELTNTLTEQFYKELEIDGDEGYGSIQMDYETVTNSSRWFTLKILVNETAASSDSYFKFYHIDKQSGRIVELGDLFNTDSFSEVLAEEVKKQMQERMEADENAVYWFEDSETGEELLSIGREHNFYWNEKGELVIVFDKYEIAPGYMGTSEFVIGKDVIKNILKDEYADVVS